MTFRGNKSEENGGAIYIEKNSLVTVSSSDFLNNVSTNGSGSVCYIVANRHVKVTFDNGCTFIGNTGEGTFYMFDADLDIKNNTWDANFMRTAIGESNGIIAMDSIITSDSNTFTNHECDSACYFYLFQGSQLTDTNSIFSNSYNT